MFELITSREDGIEASFQYRPGYLPDALLYATPCPFENLNQLDRIP